MSFANSNTAADSRASPGPFIPLLFIVSLLTGLVVFWAGLSGPFWFYDFSNLSPLEYLSESINLDNLVGFILSGDAGPGGRPLALLSFVLNVHHWPAFPWPFKYTNLLLHLLNGVLIFTLTLQLGRLITRHTFQAELLGLATMTFWLIHPMQLSTIMLVAQRMAELSATFTLLGLIAYVHGRRLATTHCMRGYIWISSGIGLGTLLALMSKENGVLLPLYALVIEATLIRAARLERPRYWRLWFGAFLMLPLFAIAGYFYFKWPSFLRGFEARGFTLAERLLTEARILVDYLAHIFIPRMAGAGLFHDDYPISTGVLAPVTTLLSVCALVALASIAVITRPRHPVLSFAILWFFAGHIMESSFVPLELYFEHRNYLPMLGPCLALAYYPLSMTGSRKRLGYIFIGLYVAMEILISAHASPVWGDHTVAVNVWARENPGSLRAQQAAADFWSRQGDHEQALRHLTVAEQLNPQSSSVRLQIIQVRCLDGYLDTTRLRAARKLIPDGRFDTAAIETVSRLRVIIDRGLCQRLQYQHLQELLDAYLRNPRYTANRKARAGIYYQKALIYAGQRQLSAAVEALDVAYEIIPTADTALLQARWLTSAGLHEAALRYVKVAKNTQPKISSLARQQAIQNLEKLVIKSIQAAPTRTEG